MLLAGRAAAQQATTLRLYSVNFEPAAAMLAFEVPRHAGGRCQIGRIIGFDMLEAALGKERAAGGLGCSTTNCLAEAAVAECWAAGSGSRLPHP